MKKIEALYGMLAREAIEHDRFIWQSLEQIAEQAQMPMSSVHQALQRLRTIGAVTVRPRQAALVTDVRKIVVQLQASRDLQRDRLAVIGKEDVGTIPEAARLVGGTHAASKLLEERLPTAQHGTGLLYVPRDVFASLNIPDRTGALADDEAVWVVDWERGILPGSVPGFTGPVQTVVDLFAMPGWRSAEFEHALTVRFMSAAEGVEAFSR